MVSNFFRKKFKISIKINIPINTYVIIVCRFRIFAFSFDIFCISSSLGSSGVSFTKIILKIAKPAIQRNNLVLKSSKKVEAKAARIKGIIAASDQYEIPTFLPQFLHFAGIAGPISSLRHIGIACLLQYGHLYIFK